MTIWAARSVPSIFTDLSASTCSLSVQKKRSPHRPHFLGAAAMTESLSGNGRDSKPVRRGLAQP